MSTQTQDSSNGWHNGWPDGIDAAQVRGARVQLHDDGTATSTVLFDEGERRRGWFRRRAQGQPADRGARWLRNAMIALAALAISAAVVSFAAQYRMVLDYRGVRAIAALEAAIPDAAALVFASLGIALALHGKRAIRARLLNVGAVATSVFMNFAASAPGWRGLAIWVMPPIAYALASDTAIGVIRAWTIARARELREALADDEATPLGDPRRAVPLAAAAGLGPVQHAYRLPPVGAGRVPGGPGPARAARPERGRAVCCPIAGQRGHLQAASPQPGHPAPWARARLARPDSRLPGPPGSRRRDSGAVRERR